MLSQYTFNKEFVKEISFVDLYLKFLSNLNISPTNSIFSEEDFLFIQDNLHLIKCMEEFLQNYKLNINNRNNFFKTYNQLYIYTNNFNNFNYKFLDQLLIVCLLFSYNESNNINLNNKKFKKQRDVIFKSDQLLNIIFDHVTHLCNKTFTLLDTKLIYMHLIGYMESGNLLTTELITYKSFKEKLICLSIDIYDKSCTELKDQNNLGIHLKPLSFNKSSNYPFFLKTNITFLTSYIRNNTLGKTKLKITNFNVLEKLLNQRFFFDKNLLNYAVDLLLKQFNLPSDLNEKDLLNFINLNYLHMQNGIIELDKKYTELLQLHALKYLTHVHDKYKDGFFYPYYFDFRGRIYCDSLVNYTNNRWTRHLLNMGEYSEQEVLEYTLKDFMCDIWNEFFLDVYKDCKYDINKYYIILTYYELGKLIKTKKKNYNGILSLRDFIILGIDLFNDTLNLIYQLEGLDLFEKNIFIFRLINNKLFFKQKLFFYRDATASGLQITSLILKPKNEEISKWLNLIQDGYWYDTYYYIIQKFINEFKINEKYVKYFNRKSLKHTIMIYNYQGSYFTCLLNFKNFLPNINEIGKKEYNEILQIFKQFYTYLGHIFNGTEIFKFSSDHIYNILKWSNNNLQQNSFNINIGLKKTKKTKLIQSKIDLDGTEFLKEFSIITNTSNNSNNCKYNQFQNEIKTQLNSIYLKNNKYPLKSFFNFLKKFKLLKTFKTYFKDKKIFKKITYTNFSKFEKYLTEKIQLIFLEYLLYNNLKSVDSVFNLYLDNGFTINYDYTSIIDKKIDIKQIFKLKELEFFKNMAIKYNYCYSEEITFNRLTLNVKEVTDMLNFKKTDLALKANIIHTIDANIIREIISMTDDFIITIHDSIGTHMLALEKCIINTQLAYSKIILNNFNGDKLVIKNFINSSFILL